MLGLAEDAGDLLGADALLELAQALGPRGGRVAERDGARDLDVEGAGEVAVGVVEDDDGLVVSGRQRRGGLGHGGVDAQRGGRCVRRIDGGIGGIGRGEFGRDHRQPDLGVLGVEPGMRIDAAMGVVVAVVSGLVVPVILVGVVVMRGGVLMVVAFVRMVVLFGGGLLMPVVMAVIVIMRIGLRLPVPVIVVMGARSVAVVHQRHARRVEKGDGLASARRRLERAGEPGGQFLPDPEDEAGVGQRGGLAGAELEGMLVRTLFDEDGGRAEVAHDERDEAVDHRRVGHHHRNVGGGGRGGEGQGGEGGGAHGAGLLVNDGPSLYTRM